MLSNVLSALAREADERRRAARLAAGVRQLERLERTGSVHRPDDVVTVELPAREILAAHYANQGLHGLAAHYRDAAA